MARKGNSMTDELKALGHKPTPVLKAIRAYCIECSGGSRSEVANCQVFRCELFPFRGASNPWRKPRVLSPEQRAEMAARLSASRRA